MTGCVPLKHEAMCMADAVPCWEEHTWGKLKPPTTEHRNSCIRLWAKQGVVYKLVPWSKAYYRSICREGTTAMMLSQRAGGHWPHHVHMLGPVVRVEHTGEALLQPPLAHLPLQKLLDHEAEAEERDCDQGGEGASITSLLDSVPPAELKAFMVRHDGLFYKEAGPAYEELAQSGHFKTLGGRVQWGLIHERLLPIAASHLVGLCPLLPRTDRAEESAQKSPFPPLLSGLPSLRKAALELGGFPGALMCMAHWAGHSLKSDHARSMLIARALSDPMDMVMGLLQQVVLHTGWVQHHGVAHLDAHLGNWLVTDVMDETEGQGWSAEYTISAPPWAEPAPEVGDNFVRCPSDWGGSTVLPKSATFRVRSSPFLCGLTDFGAAERVRRSSGEWTQLCTYGKSGRRSNMKLHAVSLHRTLTLLVHLLTDVLQQAAMLRERARMEPGLLLLVLCRTLLERQPDAGVYYWAFALRRFRRKCVFEGEVPDVESGE